MNIEADGWQRMRFGRLSLSVPPGMKLVGAEYSMADFYIGTLPWPDGVRSADALDKLWEERLVAIQAKAEEDNMLLPPPRGHLQRMPSPPNARVAFHGANIQNAVDVMADVGERVLDLRGASMEKWPRELLPGAMEILAAFRPGPLPQTMLEADVYIVGDDAVLLPFDRERQELVGMAFDDPQFGKLHIDLETSDEDSPGRGFLQDVLEGLAGAPPGIDTVRSRSVRVAGMSGGEVAVRDKKGLHFLWRCDAPKRGQLLLELEFDTRAPLDQVVPTWERILGSITTSVTDEKAKP